MKDFNMDDYSALKGSTLVKGLAGSEQLRFDSVESATGSKCYFPWRN